MGLIIETEKGKKKYISEGTPREKKILSISHQSHIQINHFP